MADLRISQLPSAGTVVSTDILPFTDVSASTTKKVAMDDLALALGILGNSVGSVAPSTPTIGQIWVDTGANPPLVKCWTGTVFGTVSFDQGTSNVTSPGSNGPSSPFTGQLWMDTSSSSTPELKIWNGNSWKRVDPDGQTQLQNDNRYLKTTDAASTYLPLAGGVMTGDLTLDGAPTSNNMAATKKFVEDAIAAINIGPSIETGMIIPYGGTSTNPPSGYRWCNGGAISRTTFSALFAVVGTRFGNGNGSTTFNVPDLRSEFIRGANTMGGNALSGGLGRTSPGQTQGDTFESHNHSAVSASNHSHSVGSAGSHGHSVSVGAGGSHTHSTPTGLTGGDSIRAFGTNDDGSTSGSGTNSAGSHGHSGSAGAAGSHNHGNTGGGGSHGHTIGATGSTETRPRSVAVTYLIKT